MAQADDVVGHNGKEQRVLRFLDRSAEYSSGRLGDALRRLRQSGGAGGQARTCNGLKKQRVTTRRPGASSSSRPSGAGRRETRNWHRSAN